MDATNPDPLALETRLPLGVATIRRSTPGLLYNIVRDPLAALPRACYEEKMVIGRNLGRLRAYICDPPLIHEALVRNTAALAKSPETKKVLGVALGEGLLTSDGAAWRWQRQALAPAFQHERLTALLPAMIAAAEATRDRWLALPPGAEVDLGHEMMTTTFRIILDTMLSGDAGSDAAAIERNVTDYLAATSWMFALALMRAPDWLPYPGRRRAEAATAAMRRSVLERIAARRRAGGGQDDLMGMSLAAADPETGRAMTDTEIADNLLTFIAAGHETTAVGLGWTLTLLAAHPDCLARLVAEIDSVTEGGPVAPRHIARFDYTRQVFSEAMRLYPPAPLIARAVERDLEIGGVTLPAGSVIFVPIWTVHRHRALWADPETFDPDRFAPETAKARHRFAFMPFGAGPRVCIGNTFAMLEAVTILAVLLKAVALERVEQVPPKPIMRITLRPARPLRMRVRPR